MSPQYHAKLAAAARSSGAAFEEGNAGLGPASGSLRAQILRGLARATPAAATWGMKGHLPPVRARRFAMRWTTSRGDAPMPDVRHPFHVTLRDGFRGHTVVLHVDHREVYRQAGVSTDPATARADAFELAAPSDMVRIWVSVAPGDYTATFDLDVARFPHLSIGLVGESTVICEISAVPFRLT